MCLYCMYVNVSVSICWPVRKNDGVPVCPDQDLLQLLPRTDHACYERGVCDRRGEPGSGSPLYYINTWAMVWPTDYPAAAV